MQLPCLEIIGFGVQAVAVGGPTSRAGLIARSFHHPSQSIEPLLKGGDFRVLFLRGHF